MAINSKLFKKIALDIFNKKEDSICIAIKYSNERYIPENMKEFRFFTEMFDPNDGIFMVTDGPWFGDPSSAKSQNARILACLFCYEMLKGEK